MMRIALLCSWFNSEEDNLWTILQLESMELNRGHMAHLIHKKGWGGFTDCPELVSEINTWYNNNNFYNKMMDTRYRVEARVINIDIHYKVIVYHLMLVK